MVIILVFNVDKNSRNWYVSTIMKNKLIIQLIAVIFVYCVVSQAPVLADAKKDPFAAVQVSGNVYCIAGGGGNIGILKIGDGLLVVDAKYEKTAPAVLKSIAALSGKPVKYLINTHYHGDHTDGNRVVGKGAELIMHPNCMAALKKSLEARKDAKSDAGYLKNFIPWTEGKTIKMGDETVKLLHFGNGHTSGDLVVVFEKAKVLHMGDLFFNGSVPYIDVKDGSDTENWIRTIETICKKYADYTIIPGHGEVTDAAGYMKFAGYLKLLRKKVATAIKEGKSKEEAMKTVTFEGYEHLSEYGDFITRKNNVGWVYDEMTRGK